MALSIAMDDFEKAEKIWETIRYSRVMDVDDDLVEQPKDFPFKGHCCIRTFRTGFRRQKGIKRQRV